MAMISRSSTTTFPTTIRHSSPLRFGDAATIASSSARSLTRSVEEGYPLGNWIGNRRAAFHGGRLDEVKVLELERVIGWSWDPEQDAWEDAVERVRRYFSNGAVAPIKRSFIDSDGFKLGHWANNRRAQHRKGKLPKDRVAVLESINGWTW